MSSLAEPNPPWRTALITGASSGIGRALALELAGAGVHVILGARRRAKLQTLANEIQLRGGLAEVCALDVADTDACAATIRALDGERPIELVIANAGAGPRALDDDRDRDRDNGSDAAPAYAWEVIEEAFHTNFCGAAVTLTAALPAMVARGRGHLVGISSLASFGALPAAASYCAPKAGLSMLLDCLRLDLADAGVAVTSVHAGFVRTPMLEATHALPQLLEPEVFAARVVRRLPARPDRIDIPQPLALGARLFARLPRRLRALALRRARR